MNTFHAKPLELPTNHYRGSFKLLLLFN